MIRAPYIFLVLWLSAYALSCQTVGYMGKRLSIGADVMLGLSVRHPNAQGAMMGAPRYYNIYSPNAAALGPKQGFALSLIPGLRCDYVTARQVSAGIGFMRISTRTYGGRLGLSYNTSSNPGWSTTVAETSPAIGMFDIKGATYTAGIKLFMSGCLAPYGNYFGIDAAVTAYRALHDTASFYAEQVSVNPGTNELIFTRASSVNFGPAEQRFVRFDLLMSMGRQRIYYRNLLVNCALRFSANAILQQMYSSVGNLGKTLPETYIRELGAQRMGGLMLMNAYISVSWLFK